MNSNRFITLVTLSMSLAVPALAMVGNAPEIRDAKSQPETMLVGSRGTFCTGTIIGRDLVLTAAHCVLPGADYKLIERVNQVNPLLRDVGGIARHPQFDLKSLLAHRATADIALMKVSAPLNVRPAPLLAPRSRVAIGERFVVRGYGVAKRGDGTTSGTLREAALIATGQPGNLQLRLVDPMSGNSHYGLGACTGDSGAPVYQATPSGLAVYGVVSWSTGPAGAEGCGGLTGVTPLELYRGWLNEQTKKMGAAIQP